MARQIPWDIVKRQYVQGVEKDGKRVYPTMRDLADKYECNVSTVGRHAKAEDWAVQREIFANKLQTECKRKTIEVLSDAGSDFDLKAFRIAQAGLKRIQDALEGEVPMLPEDVNRLASASRTFHQTGRLALGEPTDTTEQRHRGQVDLSVLTDEELRSLESITKRLEHTAR